MRMLKPDGKCNICGERVRLAREEAGLSQEQLAAKLQLQGYPLLQKAISRIETGSRAVHDYEIPMLAEVLRVDPLWLLGLTEKEPL